MRRSPLSAGIALLLWATAGLAQSPPTAAIAALRPFALWVGDWKGSGWSVSATGQRTEFTLEETVSRKAGGSVLLIEGAGKNRAGEAVTHDGIALVYYDTKSGRYRWNGHDATAGAVEAEPKLVDGGFEWSIVVDGRGTTVRFTILFDEKRWHEFGEASTDGRHWARFMEMTLERRPLP